VLLACDASDHTRLWPRADDRFFARPWSVLDGRQRPISQRPLHAALNRLMMDPNSSPHDRTRILAIRQQHLRPADTRLAGSVLDRERAFNPFNLFVVIASSTARRHPARSAPRFANRKRGIRHQPLVPDAGSWNRSSSNRSLDSACLGYHFVPAVRALNQSDLTINRSSSPTVHTVLHATLCTSTGYRTSASRYGSVLANVHRARRLFVTANWIHIPYEEAKMRRQLERRMMASWARAAMGVSCQRSH